MSALPDGKSTEHHGLHEMIGPENVKRHVYMTDHGEYDEITVLLVPENLTL